MPYYPPVDVRSSESAWKQADFNRLILKLAVLGAIYCLVTSYLKWYRQQRRPRQGKARRRESQAVTTSGDSGSQALSRSSQRSNAKLRARSKDHRALPKPAASTCHRKLLAGVVVTEQERDLKQDSESEEEATKDAPTLSAAVGGLSMEVDAEGSTAGASCAAAGAGKRRKARSRSRKRVAAKNQVDEDTVPRPQHNLDATQDAAVKKVDVFGLDQARSSTARAPASHQPSTARASTLPSTSTGSSKWTAVPAAHAAKPALSPVQGPLRPSHVAAAEQGSSARARSVGSPAALPPATRAGPSQRATSSAPADRGLSREPLERVAPTYNEEVGKRRAYSNYRVPRTLRMHDEQPMAVQGNFSMHAAVHEFPSLSVSEGRRSRSSSRKPAAAEVDSAAGKKSMMPVGEVFAAKKPADSARASGAARGISAQVATEAVAPATAAATVLLIHRKAPAAPTEAAVKTEVPSRTSRKASGDAAAPKTSSSSSSGAAQDKKSVAKEDVEEGFWRQDTEPSGKSSTGHPLNNEESSALPEAPARARNRFGKAVPRPVMIAKLFSALDLDGDGCLDIVEMRRFAELTGFDGDAHVWAEEYRLLCEEQKCQTSKGLGLDAFVDLVDDKSGSGCYCKDSELLSLRKKLGSPGQTEQAKAATSSCVSAATSSSISAAPSAQEGRGAAAAKAMVVTPSSPPLAHKSQTRVAPSDHKRKDDAKMPPQDAHRPSGGSLDCKPGDTETAPKQSDLQCVEAVEIDKPPRRGREMQARGKAAPKRRGPAGAPVNNTWAPQLPSTFSHASHRAPSRPRARVKAAAGTSGQAAKTSRESAAAVEISTQAAKAAEKVKECVEIPKADLKAAIPTPLAAEKPQISDPVKSSALPAAGADEEVQHNPVEDDARELNDEPTEFQESGEGGFLFEEFEVSGNNDLGPFAGDDVTANVEESQGNVAEGLQENQEERHSCCIAGDEKGKLANKIKEKDTLDDNTENCQELFLNTCAACGETWLLPMDLGDDFCCQDAGKPCGEEASQAAVSTFLLAETSNESPDAVKGTAGTQSRPRILRQILADGLGVLDATNLLLSHGFEPLYNGELEDVKQEIRRAATARNAAARKEAAYNAERGNRKRTQRYLDGQLVDLPKGSKFLVENKETAEDKQKTSVSIAIIGSRSKPMKDPSEKKKGPQTRV